MKIWDKGIKLNKEIENFTVGNDHIIDKELLPYDCIASIAHAKMLAKMKIITDKEYKILVKGLNEILKNKNFNISKVDEDCHTAIENHLVKKYGEVGKKIHSARSRNDQVLTALRLYELVQLGETETLLKNYIKALDNKIKKSGKIKMPGYTHMQRAMPTTIGMWLGSYKDAASDTLSLLSSVQKLIDQSPLGSAAGFGVPILKIDRKFTAKEMGFSKVMENPMYCQLSRGMFEATILSLLSTIMLQLNRISTDLMMFSMKEFGFVSLPKEFCTGSSIMPQKKNPDVLELMRAKYNIILGEEFKLKSLSSNLISGYNRDMQLTKEPLINSFNIAKETLKISNLVTNNLTINKKECESALDKDLFATEKAYKLVKNGMPFRDAYRRIAEEFK